MAHTAEELLSPGSDGTADIQYLISLCPSSFQPLAFVIRALQTASGLSSCQRGGFNHHCRADSLGESQASLYEVQGFLKKVPGGATCGGGGR